MANEIFDTAAGFLVRAGERAQVLMGALAFQFELWAGQTAGRLSDTEMTLDPHRRVPPHVHADEDEYTYVAAGTMVRGGPGMLSGPRFHVHFTPTGSSWINQVERWFGYLTDQKIRRGVHKSVQALEADIRRWIEHWNEDPRPFTWIKTADISGAEH
jgi:hypothetical protein